MARDRINKAHITIDGIEYETVDIGGVRTVNITFRTFGARAEAGRASMDAFAAAYERARREALLRPPPPPPPPAISKEERKRLYRALARLLHPDAPPHPQVADEHRTKLMAEVNNAYERQDGTLLKKMAVALGVA